MLEQLAAGAEAARFRPHKEIFQIKAGAPEERGIVRKEQREADRSTVEARD